MARKDLSRREFGGGNLATDNELDTAITAVQADIDAIADRVAVLEAAAPTPPPEP